MYNPEDTAEALKDLLCNLQNSRGKKMTYVELSEDIKNKTGVRISNASLHDYSTGKKNKAMNVKNLVALADYFDVSFDFLIGRSISRKHEHVDISSRIGLNSYAIELLETFYQTPNFDDKGNTTLNSYTHLINQLLCDMEFMNLLTQLSFLKHSKIEGSKEDAVISYSPEMQQYIYKEETIVSEDFKQLENLKEKLYGKEASIIHSHQYQELLKFNATQSLNKIIEKLIASEA